MARLKLFLFGAPRVFLDDAPVHFTRRKALALLLYLAAQERPQSRETLGAMFWPEATDSRNQLRVALAEVRRLLGGEWLDEHDGLIALARPAGVWVDAVEFRVEAEAADASRLAAAVDLVQGGFLEGFSLAGCPGFDDWQLLKGQALERELERALRRLAECLEAQGDTQRAIHFASWLLARDDLNEPAYRLLMRLYARDRQLHQVRRVYGECAGALHAQLGIRPGRETEALYRQILAARDARDADGVAGEVARPRAAIPYVGQQFFGRQEEQAQVLRRLSQPGCRLVTILGTGGIGKTHLVAKVSEHVQPLFPGGITFLALDTMTDGEEFLLAVAGALSIHLGMGPVTPAHIAPQIRERSLLLILDNAEHLAPDAGPLLAELLQRTTGLKVLATSRVRLGLHGEYVVPLHGLEYPAPELRPLTLQEARTTPAVQLFVHWGQKRVAGFDLTPENVEDVAALCAAVQGVPLAIRLAAAWCGLLDLHELLLQVEASFEILEDALGDVPERHRSARALFNSAWAQLGDGDRQVFLSLAEFRGGFTRDAARDVAGVSPAELKSLLDKSLLMLDGGGRYHIHRILRFFALEKLPAAGLALDRLRRRYAAFYAEFIHERTAELRGRDQIAALTRMDAEYLNIQHAWRLAVEQRLYGAAEMMIEGFLLYVKYRGFWHDGHRLFAELGAELARLDDPAGRRLRDKLAARSCRATPGWLARLGEMLRGAGQAGDGPEVAYLTLEIGCILRFLGWAAPAQAYFSRALGLYEALGEEGSVAAVLRAMAHGLILADELGPARERADRALAISRRVGDRFGTAEARDLAAELALMAGDVGAATEHLEWAYELWKAHYGEHSGLVQARLLPWCYFFAGEPEQSERLAERLLLVADRETATDHGLALRLLALLAAARGDADKSAQLREQSEIELSRDDVTTMRARLVDDHDLYLLSEWAAALLACLHGEYDRGRRLTARLLDLPMTHRRPFLLRLLAAVDALAPALEHGRPTAALRGWAEEQRWLGAVIRSYLRD